MPLAPLRQILIHLVTDAARTYPSQERFATGHLLEQASLDWFYSHYQTGPADRLDWCFSPSQAPTMPGSRRC